MLIDAIVHTHHNPIMQVQLLLPFHRSGKGILEYLHNSFKMTAQMLPSQKLDSGLFDYKTLAFLIILVGIFKLQSQTKCEEGMCNAFGKVVVLKVVKSSIICHGLYSNPCVGHPK